MAASDDLINFDIIENQKENIQSLPGGRSAKELARIFSPRDPSDSLASPSPNETRTLNDAIRQEYEAELKAIDDSDDPLDIYDRYVKWTLNAYPSSQATAESGLLPLLESAVKAFLNSPLYKNDPRYLRLWLHYIRLFSDSPRETFAFLARHHIGEGLALFYEEFAAWLEGAGRWTQAEEVYRLGVDREARPTERLIRKYSEFQRRYEQRTQDSGPSSPALPAVRPALAAKIDPFSLPATAGPDAQVQRPAPSTAAAPRTKSGKPKMAIFSDTDPAASQPAVSEPTKGWDSIGSMQERRKENRVEARPWAGETLKAGKKAAPKEKMAIFRDESKSDLPLKESVPTKHIPEHHVREAVNPRTGRRERVFVNLEAVYPDHRNPSKEISFEELRAMHRGWMDKDWRSQKAPLKQISGNVACPEIQAENFIEQSLDHELPEQFNRKLTVKDADSQEAQLATDLQGSYEGKSGKARKMKLREVKGETQTIKMKFDSPTKHKVRRKSTAEPTMTIHTRAATDEIYSIFNQPLKAETEIAESSDFDDDDYTSAGESTVTGHLSAASSDFGDDETTTFHRSDDEADEDFDDETRAESVIDGEWTQYSAKDDADLLPPDSLVGQDNTSVDETARRERFVPEMPEDYNPPYGPYRDPAVVAQNRLPFMTPIVERTEHSFPSMTAARNSLYNTKTPSKPQMGNLLMTPLVRPTPQQSENLIGFPEDVAMSPTAQKARSSPRLLSPLKGQQQQHRAVINEAQCNPTDKTIRNTILHSLDPPLMSYQGYHGHPEQDSHYAPAIQKFVKTHIKRPRSGDEASFDVPILELPGAERSYIIRRELGAGAYAPVYLAESVDSLEACPSSDSDDGSRGSQFTAGRRSMTPNTSRFGFEAIKLEVGPPNAWEFYMIRTAHERLNQMSDLSRAADSIIRAHELHVYKGESILVEDYRGQGTLLDLVNMIRNESITANGTSEGGLDEALAMFFTVELFRTVEALHACGILHGDIKADNCLVRFDDKSTTPSLLDLDEEITDPRELHYSPRGLCGWRSRGLSLIDFGRGIDMHAFQPSVQFMADWETGKHECNEIREMRPWTHQIDLYGLAGTVHVMLFGKYIESTPVRKSEGGSATMRTYRIRESFKRYWDREIWSDVFDLLLNPGAERWVQMELGATNPGPVDMENPAVLPVLQSMRYVRSKMEDWLLANAEKKSLGLQIRKLEAVVAERKKKLERS
ncbi:putative checkpoint protein kinase (SldA) [Aspergillus clavatus NRRL 1]|uniref:Checkpoint protein kinase (SldA), putative n=1 Tax=Aspergillus clavatus (strain ATCC 1007 / CBS 513.65 / DSM 816 / NCTC 3887 / NRRL 1 / QM 1276 / 107) TaxID=344612 RepID=A1CTC6_ASPCL|nr:checkpoint protein kinase (SldA), putative [Aspergillus clavatus NRRL 1]EAW06563.1 checkpoint protein kinase (SldA), putative [Aspergillus clavatus NRRL 1]